MKNLMMILVASLVALPTMAEQGAPTPEENYTMFCGTRKQLVDFLVANGQDVSRITDADFVELNQTRKPVLRILQNGQRAIDQILDQGSKSDTGPFGAILACSVIVGVKTQIQQNGCVDLATNKIVRDKGGIAACEELMKRIPR
ncbi:MAG: hypothetical protein BroJett040_16180 [Oligoflexia bacterium]|nr:MAG: hypothetical protein BroJett040_16180 [Oligoflexia bacterium]